MSMVWPCSLPVTQYLAAQLRGGSDGHLLDATDSWRERRGNENDTHCTSPTGGAHWTASDSAMTINWSRDQAGEVLGLHD